MSCMGFPRSQSASVEGLLVIPYVFIATRGVLIRTLWMAKVADQRLKKTPERMPSRNVAPVREQTKKWTDYGISSRVRGLVAASSINGSLWITSLTSSTRGEIPHWTNLINTQINTVSTNSLNLSPKTSHRCTLWIQLCSVTYITMLEAALKVSAHKMVCK